MLYVHDMARLSRQSITCSENALIIYSLTKGVERGRGDHILYIVDSS